MPNFRSYIENCLNFEIESANQHLDGVVWKMDTAKQFDSFAGNAAGLSRGMLFQQNESVDLIGRLHVDMFNTLRYLVNNIDFALTLELNNPNFYLMKKTDANKSSLLIEDATLYIEHIAIAPQILLQHNKILETTNAVYPYKRCEVRNFTIAENSNSFAIDNIVNGVLPELCIISMVENSVYQGQNAKGNVVFLSIQARFECQIQYNTFNCRQSVQFPTFQIIIIQCVREWNRNCTQKFGVQLHTNKSTLATRIFQFI